MLYQPGWSLSCLDACVPCSQRSPWGGLLAARSGRKQLQTLQLQFKTAGQMCSISVVGLIQGSREGRHRVCLVRPACPGSG